MRRMRSRMTTMIAIPRQEQSAGSQAAYGYPRGPCGGHQLPGKPYFRVPTRADPRPLRASLAGGMAVPGWRGRHQGCHPPIPSSETRPRAIPRRVRAARNTAARHGGIAYDPDAAIRAMTLQKRQFAPLAKSKLNIDILQFYRRRKGDPRPQMKEKRRRNRRQNSERLTYSPSHKPNDKGIKMTGKVARVRVFLLALVWIVRHYG